MKKKAIIYLHGFNSASLDIDGNLLTGKEKLFVMQEFCAEKLFCFIRLMLITVIFKTSSKIYYLSGINTWIKATT